jgi:hypothetical protein
VSLFESLGFKNHPFEQSNADEEPELDQYFVRPKFFNAVIGDPKRPASNVIFAPRGGGKTAQRRMVQIEADRNGFLAVAYDRFDLHSRKRAADITSEMHLDNIITRIFVAYLSLLERNMRARDDLTDRDRQLIAAFAKQYLKDITGGSFQELLREIKTAAEATRDFWRENVSAVEPVADFITKWLGLPTLKLPRNTKKAEQPMGPQKAQLESLIGLVRASGLKSIYILIDKVDETPLTHNNPKNTYDLIKPLLVDLDLLSINGCCFKFFLWDKVQPFYKDDARPDRVPSYELKWQRKSLEGLLSQRLKVFSANAVSSFGMLAPNLRKADAALCLFANLSPRSLIRVCNRVFAAQGEIDNNASYISNHAIDTGTEEYCNEYVRESYQAAALSDIQRINSELFTIADASKVFKISANAARTKILGLAELGLVKQVTTVKVDSSNKPIHLYCVTDPCIVRVLHQKKPIDELIDEMWMECKSCGTDNLFDGRGFKENDPICMGCSRSLAGGNLI